MHHKLDVILFDKYSKEISWSLVDACSGEELIAKEYGIGENSDNAYQRIPKGRYMFALNDSWDDGLSTGPDGNITVNYDGEDVEFEKVGNFGYFARGTFGEEGIICPPAPVPTSSPTSAPTEVACAEDDATFEVDIVFDHYSDDI